MLILLPLHPSSRWITLSGCSTVAAKSCWRNERQRKRKKSSHHPVDLYQQSSSLPSFSWGLISMSEFCISVVSLLPHFPQWLFKPFQGSSDFPPFLWLPCQFQQIIPPPLSQRWYCPTDKLPSDTKSAIISIVLSSSPPSRRELNSRSMHLRLYCSYWSPVIMLNSRLWFSRSEMGSESCLCDRWWQYCGSRITLLVAKFKIPFPWPSQGLHAVNFARLLPVHPTASFLPFSVVLWHSQSILSLKWNTTPSPPPFLAPLTPSPLFSPLEPNVIFINGSVSSGFIFPHSTEFALTMVLSDLCITSGQLTFFPCHYSTAFDAFNHSFLLEMVAFIGSPTITFLVCSHALSVSCTRFFSPVLP